MRKIRLLLAAVLLFIPFAACSREGTTDYFIEFEISQEVYVDGEPISVSERNKLKEEISALLFSIEDEVSVEKPDSDVSRINRAAAGEELIVGEHTYAMLQMSENLYARTDGAFSTALYNLSELWNFTPEYEGQYSQTRAEPSEQEIAVAKAASSISDTRIGQNNTVSKQNGETKLDFGGIAKGYMSDVAAQHIRNAYSGKTVECTLSVLSNTVFLGQKHDGSLLRGYNIGIENPRKLTTSASDALFLTGIHDAAISTSADTYRFYVYDGKIYSHIIDPATGKPSDNGVISITAIVPLSVPSAGALADAYSTAGFCMSLTEALAFYQGLWEAIGTGAVILTADFRYYVVGDFSVLNRKDYAHQTAPELEASTKNVFTYAQASEASDAVTPCEEELKYIERVAELS